jgi:hypothetical protein
MSYTLAGKSVMALQASATNIISFGILIFIDILVSIYVIYIIFYGGFGTHGRAAGQRIPLLITPRHWAGPPRQPLAAVRFATP